MSNSCRYLHDTFKKIILFGGCAVLLSLFTVSVQVHRLTLPYLEGRQLQRHQAVMQGSAPAPWQYRIFSAYLAEGMLRTCARLHVAAPVSSAFIGLRLLQNSLIFFVAALYYQRLGFPAYHTLLGLSLLAWGISYARHDSDLQFNTYFDVLFYLLAGWCIVQRRARWIVPVTIVAALNRETSGLIPVMAAAAGYWGPPASRRAMLRRAALAFGGYIVIFAGLRLIIGPRPLFVPYGHQPGWDLFWYNAGRLLTYHQLFAVFSLLPLLACSSYRRWPRVIHIFFWTLVPLWVTIHAFTSVMAEARLFLVPFSLIVIPGALAGLGDVSQNTNHGL